MNLQTSLIDGDLHYDGSQLASHFGYRRLGLLGDSAVGFVGGCEVKLERMVDLEDVRAEAPIYSPKMLHFILESFQLDLKAGVLWQRLCIAQIKELLESGGVRELRRSGDDLYRGANKLSVSIATRSPVSTLIHIGLNVLTEGTPVPTLGLKELGVEEREFGRRCLQAFAEEYRSVLEATCKVRGVP